MSILEPDDDDIFNQMEDIFKNVDTTDPLGLESLTTIELLDRRADIDAQLTELNELTQLTKSTPEGRELHSERGAITITLKKRGIT